MTYAVAVHLYDITGECFRFRVFVANCDTMLSLYVRR